MQRLLVLVLGAQLFAAGCYTRHTLGPYLRDVRVEGDHLRVRECVLTYDSGAVSRRMYRLREDECHDRVIQVAREPRPEGLASDVPFRAGSVVGPWWLAAGEAADAH